MQAVYEINKGKISHTSVNVLKTLTLTPGYAVMWTNAWGHCPQVSQVRPHL